MKVGGPDRRDTVLRYLLVAVILSLAGPEIFAALEVTALLELFGAALFLTAYRVALLALVGDTCRFVAGVIMPALPVAILRDGGSPLRKVEALVYLLQNAVWCVAFAIICVVFLAEHVV